MERQPGINAVAKQRQREAINDQVKRFLERGGSITVIETPRADTVRHIGSTWPGADAELLRP
jgi:hypothetical protein